MNAETYSSNYFLIVYLTFDLFENKHSKSAFTFSDYSDASESNKDISSKLISPLDSHETLENKSVLINPALIPSVVKNSLLELHDHVCMSKSDSNIKSKRQNNLLRPPVTQKASAGDKKSIFTSKKSLSLQIGGSNNKKVTYRDKAGTVKGTMNDRIMADCQTNQSTLPFSLESSVENLINN